jgi:hypothetical protein
MPPSQKNIVQKSSAGISTPPPINTASDQSGLSARERLRLHVQRNLQAQEQKARQLAEQAAVSSRSGLTIPVITPKHSGTIQSSVLQSLYAPIQDTRLGLSDISESRPPSCLLPEPSPVASDAFSSNLNNSSDLELLRRDESPPEYDDTPPFENDQEWSSAVHVIESTDHLDQEGDEDWVEGLIDTDTLPKS